MKKKIFISKKSSKVDKVSEISGYYGTIGTDFTEYDKDQCSTGTLKTNTYKLNLVKGAVSPDFLLKIISPFKLPVPVR